MNWSKTIKFYLNLYIIGINVSLNQSEWNVIESSSTWNPYLIGTDLTFTPSSWNITGHKSGFEPQSDLEHFWCNVFIFEIFKFNQVWNRVNFDSKCLETQGLNSHLEPIPMWTYSEWILYVGSLKYVGSSSEYHPGLQVFKWPWWRSRMARLP